MKLNGDQLGQLQQALLSSYYSEGELSQMVRMQLDQNLAAIADGDNLGGTVFKLIGWAERTGNLKKLVEGAQEHNPGNAELKLWIDTHGDALDAEPTLDASPVNSNQPPTNTPWWNQVGDNSIGGLDIDTNGGDVIIANIGPGSKNVAVGKNITQQIYAALGEPTPDDAQIIAEQFEALAANLQNVQEQTRSIAEMQLDLLKGELSKTDEAETPSASTITKVGDWLLGNAPELVEDLTTLFGLPAVGKVLGKAGEAAINWARGRFA